MIDAGIFLALQDAHAAEGQRFHLVFTGHDADRRDEFDVVLHTLRQHFGVGHAARQDDGVAVALEHDGQQADGLGDLIGLRLEDQVGVAVDEFQHICYAHPELTPKERTYQWHLLEEKYMPWRKYESDPFLERGGYWYHKLHIYLYPFYYINYTLTTMGAMEFKKKYAEDKAAAWQDYLKLCKTGGSRSYLETLRYANLANPFDAGSVERACGYAEEILLKQIAEQEQEA